MSRKPLLPVLYGCRDRSSLRKSISFLFVSDIWIFPLTISLYIGKFSSGNFDPGRFDHLSYLRRHFESPDLVEVNTLPSILTLNLPFPRSVKPLLSLFSKSSLLEK